MMDLSELMPNIIDQNWNLCLTRSSIHVVIINRIPDHCTLAWEASFYGLSTPLSRGDFVVGLFYDIRNDVALEPISGNHSPLFVVRVETPSSARSLARTSGRFSAAKHTAPITEFMIERGCWVKRGVYTLCACLVTVKPEQVPARNHVIMTRIMRSCKKNWEIGALSNCVRWLFWEYEPGILTRNLGVFSSFLFSTVKCSS